jgi:hypothetical protein
MTRFEASHIIYDIINSGIISEELEDELAEIVSCICENSFEICPSEVLRYCKMDECDNAEEWNEDDEDEDDNVVESYEEACNGECEACPLLQYEAIHDRGNN